MSKCVACGGFYNERCTRWPACTPEPPPEPTKLHVVSVGENYVISPDAILEAWQGRLSHVVLIGIGKDGEAHCISSHSPNFSLWMVEKAKKDFLV